MKTIFTTQKPHRAGNALVLTMVMLGVALAILAGVMSWSSNITRPESGVIRPTIM